METILHSLPSPENVLELEPEELAGYVIAYLNSLPDNEQTRQSQLNRNNFSGSLFYYEQDCPPKYRALTQSERKKITEALMEAWFWVRVHGGSSSCEAPEPHFISASILPIRATA